jgi:AraC family transcriptional regulator, transcriptional activator of the genes for pyochelin and ferripyochelin receptors
LTILFSKEHGEIVCSHPNKEISDIPSLFANDSDDVRSLGATGAFGKVLFHELSNENYSIRQNNYSFERDTNLSVLIDTPSLGLHYTLKNDMRYTIHGFPEGLIMKNQYNMVYVPNVQWDYTFLKGVDYTCFTIHFTLDYLQRCIEAIAPLRDFLEKVKMNAAAIISQTHLTATPEILTTINNILQCNYTGSFKKMYVEIKVHELLLLSLQNISNTGTKSKIVLRPSDLEKLHEARQYIVDHMDNPGTLKELAHNVGMNDFKFKNGFKQIFGTTVFGLLHEERMHKAKILLQETEMSVLDISVVTGYKNLSNFTAAFKKRFGYPPSATNKKH